MNHAYADLHRMQCNHLVSYVFFSVPRVQCVFDLCKCKLHINLRSELLSRIFIADSIKAQSGGHRVEVSPWDGHKLLLLGGIMHIAVDPRCLFMIYRSIQYTHFPSEEALHVALDPFINLGLTVSVFVVLGTINDSKVK